MPEGYTHVRTAVKAATAIHYKIKCPAAFAAGANGPDSLFCYQIMRKPSKRLYDLPAFGNRMHEEKTGLFLRNLLRHVKTRAQVEYALGFLCHYATDTVVHPYVYALCQPGQPYEGKGGHGYFEIALDSTLHAEDTGVAQVSANDTSPRMPNTDLAEICTLLHNVIEETYGEDIPVEYLADAFYDMYRCRKLFTSRHGLRKFFFGILELLMGKRGFITCHVSPRALKADLPEIWTDPFTGTEHTENAFSLVKQAQKRSEMYMSGALQNWVGVLSDAELEKLLGSMSYTEGRATEKSDPSLAPPPPQPQPQEEKTETAAAPQTPAAAENAAGTENAAPAAPEAQKPPEAAATPEAETAAAPETPATPVQQAAEPAPAQQAEPAVPAAPAIPAQEPPAPPAAPAEKAEAPAPAESAEPAPSASTIDESALMSALTAALAEAIAPAAQPAPTEAAPAQETPASAEHTESAEPAPDAPAKPAAEPVAEAPAEPQPAHDAAATTQPPHGRNHLPV